jgi:hypothetical protein
VRPAVFSCTVTAAEHTGGIVRIGLLWFDDSKKRSLEEKVSAAAAAYRAKPHFEEQPPNVCYVHHGMLLDDQEIRCDGVRVVPASNIPPFHLFVGVEEKEK